MNNDAKELLAMSAIAAGAAVVTGAACLACPPLGIALWAIRRHKVKKEIAELEAAINDQPLER